MNSPVEPILKLSHVSLVRDQRTILSDVNLIVNRGDFMAVTGPNGGGKTSLMRLILGLLPPSDGQITIYDSEGKASGLRPKFGYLPQKNSVDSHFPITVREVVASALLSEKLSADICRERVLRALTEVDMLGYADRPIGRLSGGQLQRVLFARATVSRAPVLVLDEPLSYLDKHFEGQLYNLIADYASHATVILVSHEMSRIDSMATRHIVVDRRVSELHRGR